MEQVIREDRWHRISDAIPIFPPSEFLSLLYIYPHRHFGVNEIWLRLEYLPELGVKTSYHNF